MQQNRNPYKKNASAHRRQKSAIIPALTSCLLFILIFLSALCIAPAASFAADGRFGGGDGSEASPYLIEDAADLAAFRDIVNGADGQTTNGGAHAKLTADIDLSKAGYWEPIGNYTKRAMTGNPEGNKYSGVFDGGGHIIKELTVAGLRDNFGLFGYIEGGTVKNLTVTGDIFGDFSITAPSAGMIAGYSYNGAIENCHTLGSVQSGAASSNTCLGGIVGQNAGGAVTGCTNAASVSGRGAAYSGGIAGSNLVKGRIANCTNSGNVNGREYSGGIAGSSVIECLIINCLNSGDIDGENYTGGVAGKNSGTIDNCGSSGSVHCSSTYTGGIAGCNDGLGTISDCTNTGRVERDKFMSANGIAGENRGSITNCGWLEGTAAYGANYGNDAGGVYSFTSEEQESIITTLAASIDDDTITPGETAEITLYTSPGDAEFGEGGEVIISAQSSDADVASVSDNGDGTITVLGGEKGTAAITVNAQIRATAGASARSGSRGVEDTLEYETSFSVTVGDRIPLTAISLSVSEINMTVGETDALTVTYDPADTTDEDITWTSDRPDVVSVNAGTTDGTAAIEALRHGDATITAESSVDGSVTARCTVHVAQAGADGAAPPRGGGNGGCSAGFGAFALFALIPLALRRVRRRG